MNYVKLYNEHGITCLLIMNNIKIIGNPLYCPILQINYIDIYIKISKEKDLVKLLVGRVFPNGPEDRGSVPDRFIPKTLKMLLDTSLLNTQQYEVHIKG